ncbi:hypothetical protein ACRRTK_003575 [Alexandromys fortis]
MDVAYGRVFILHFYGLFYNVGLGVGRKRACETCPPPVFQLSGCPPTGWVLGHGKAMAPCTFLREVCRACLESAHLSLGFRWSLATTW